MKPTSIAVVGLCMATIAWGASATEMTGAYLVKEVLDCTGCHGKDLAGRDRKFGGPGREAYGQNITPHPTEGIGRWSKAEIMTALRQCKRPDGSTIGGPMPCVHYQKTPDAWLEKAIAYITDANNVPAVAKQMPPSKYKKPQPTFPPVSTPVGVPNPSDAAAYGAALATAAHCMECHEIGPAAKPHRFGPVAAPPMSVLANAYTKPQLIKVLKSNTRLDGAPLKGPMRGRLRGLTDADYDALWAYVSTHR